MSTLSTPTDEELIDELENRLNDLAPRWRGAASSQEAERLISEYQSVLRAMLALGYDDWLDMDALLPERYMPAEYVERKVSPSHHTNNAKTPLAAASNLYENGDGQQTAHDTGNGTLDSEAASIRHLSDADLRCKLLEYITTSEAGSLPTTVLDRLTAEVTRRRATSPNWQYSK